MARAALALLTVVALLTSTAQAAVGSKVGEAFHNIRFSDQAGAKHTLADYRGKVVLVKFWGSWCGICRHKWPKHQALYNELKDDGDVAVLTISFAESLKTSKAYTESQDFSVPLYHGSNLGIIKTVDGAPFQPLGTPYHLLIDRDGIIRHRWIGAQSGVTAEMVRGLL